MTVPALKSLKNPRLASRTWGARVVLEITTIALCGGVLMIMHVPAEITRGGFVDGACYGGEVGGDVVLESALADVAQELLHLRNFDDARATEGLERIVGEFAFADVAANFSSEVIGREAKVAHISSFDAA